MSVIGIDDHEMAAVLDLTTVGQSASEQGTTAAQLLMHVLESGTEGPTVQPVLLPTQLILRGSTAPRPCTPPTGPPTDGSDERRPAP
jgi:DNA-binding LacI/PurR family transcriptional regulator